MTRHLRAFAGGLIDDRAIAEWINQRQRTIAADRLEHLALPVRPYRAARQALPRTKAVAR